MAGPRILDPPPWFWRLVEMRGDPERLRNDPILGLPFDVWYAQFGDGMPTDLGIDWQSDGTAAPE